jgi:hypothetical protein
MKKRTIQTVLDPYVAGRPSTERIGAGIALLVAFIALGVVLSLLLDSFLGGFALLALGSLAVAAIVNRGGGS